MLHDHSCAATASYASPAEAFSDDRRFATPDTRAWPARWRVPTATDLQVLEAAYRRGLLPVHTPLLHEPMPPLTVGSADAEEVAQRLYAAARREAAAGMGQLVGLAAPQVGIPARALLFDSRDDAAGKAPPVEELRCVINPTVDAVGHELIREVEGCFSTGPIKGWLHRAARVQLRGYTSAGDPISEEYTGLASQVLQHEADHLDGILFPQRVTDDYDLLWASTEQDEQFTAYARAHRRGEQPPWNTRMPRDQWDAIRVGVAVLGRLVDPADDTA